MFGHKAIVVIVTDLLFFFLDLIFSYFLFKIFNPSVFGIIYFFNNGVIGLLSIISTLGINKAHVKYLSENYNVRECVKTFFKIRGILVLIQVVSSFIFYLFNYLANVEEFLSLESFFIFIILLIGNVVTKFSDVLYNTYVGLKNSFKMVAPKYVMKFMNYFYLILIIFIYRDIFFYSFLFIANATIFLATNLFLYRKQTGGEIKDPNLAKKYLHFAYPLILNSIITGIASNIRLYLLGLNMSSFEVGLYGFSLTIISFFKLFVTNNRNLIQSQLFEAHNMDNKQREKKFIFDMEYMIALLFSPFFLIFILLINDILTIYPGGEYIQATSILSILLFRSAISFINIPYNELLFVNNRKIFSTIHVLNCLLYLGLIIFFPNIGSFLIVKIGLFTVLQEIIYLILNRYYARKFSNFWLNPRALKPILCAIIFFIIVYVLKRNFASINPFLNIALFGGLSVGIYLAILLLIKGFTKADLKFILNLINPKEILSNLKEEIRMDKKETK